MKEPAPSYKIFAVKSVYDWVLSLKETPYLWIRSSYPGVRAPTQFASETDRMRFNISPACVKGLTVNSDTGHISFFASFNGIYAAVNVPIEAVESIFSLETKQGLEFEVQQPSQVEPLVVSGRQKASLHLVN